MAPDVVPALVVAEKKLLKYVAHVSTMFRQHEGSRFMIESPEEFVRLRTSKDPDQYRRAAHETAPPEVWLAIIEKFPEMRQWVAHNKTILADIYFALYETCKDGASGTDE